VRDGCQRTRRTEGRARRREPAVRGYKRAERVTREFDPSALVGRASTMSAPPAFFLTFSAASCAFDSTRRTRRSWQPFGRSQRQVAICSCHPHPSRSRTSTSTWANL